MRPPRYRFPDEVRSTTRTIATRTVDDGTVAGTPEELDGWISGRPEIRAILVEGGYDSAFTAHDLFPLYLVFVEKAGGAAPPADAPPPPSRNRWIVGLLLAIAVVILLIVLATNVLSSEVAGENDTRAATHATSAPGSSLVGARSLPG